jgi:hypothetical protein
MASEVLLSPGVLAIENDQSFITQQPVQAGAAIIGPTVKGKIGIPTLVTSYTDYLNKFGSTFSSGSQNYTYFTSISAYNYFNNGGTTLLVTRVVSGSLTNWTSATSSFISASSFSAGGTYASNVFVLETLSRGALMNSTSPEISGSLTSGSSDNLRWQVVSPNTNDGTFSLLIRQGNDNSNSPSILESWGPLSLDPNSTNYIERVIGNQVENVASDGTGGYYIQLSGSYDNRSSYVRVKQVNQLTPDYLDNNGNPKVQFTGSLPIAASGSFGSALGSNGVSGAKYYENITNANSQGLTANDYTISISLLSNKDEFRYNLITVPGLISSFASHSSAITSLYSNCQTNGNSMAVLDVVGYGSAISTATAATVAIDNSYAATYWPWVQTIDPSTAQQVWVPASTLIPGVYAFNDNSAEAWYAPAGTNRGRMTNVIRAERYLSQTDRDTLYQSNVNPLATFPSVGVTVFGQKTLQKRASALDRVNVRRLLIELKNYISQVADSFVFEQNTVATRNNFLLQVNPYLSSVQQRNGLYGFRVVMDESNNTPTTIDNNQLIGAIYLQPTKTAEFIVLNFNILPTGASFG